MCNLRIWRCLHAKRKASYQSEASKELGETYLYIILEGRETRRYHYKIEKTLSYTTLKVQMLSQGEDYLILLKGGDCPHIGCMALAVPRPSLRSDKKEMSSTASVINVTGHKDEKLCRYLAEKIAAGAQAVTVCTGGFHVDHITESQIEEVIEAVKEIANELLAMVQTHV